MDLWFFLFTFISGFPPFQQIPVKKISIFRPKEPRIERESAAWSGIHAQAVE
jgi:hypothetical protein